MTIDINKLIQDVLLQSETLAKSLIQDFERQGMAALREYLAGAQEDLKRWTGELAQGQITQDEFKDLVQGQVTTALLAGLEQSGLAAVDLDKFTNGVVAILISVAFDYSKYIVIP